MTTAAGHIDACLAQLGGEGFALAFVDFVETLGVDQLMVFEIGAERANCLLSRHFSRSALGGRLAATYLDGWYRQDPLLPVLMAAPPGTVELRQLADFEDRMGPAYRDIFFRAPGLAAKTTVLAVGQRLRLFVSFYWTGGRGADRDPGAARLAGRLALWHFERRAETGWPAPLAVLTDRERAVCLGILSGRKTEAIADDLGIAPSTAVTYRKRAYAKLGITSRASLFAICDR